MDYTLIVFFAVVVIAGIIAFKLLQGIIKTIVTVVALSVVLVGIGAFLVVMDARDLSENFVTERNLFLLTNGSTVIFGVEVSGESGSELVNGTELARFSEFLEERDYKRVKGEYYKLILIDASIAGEDFASASAVDERSDSLVKLAEGVFSDPVYLITQYKKGNVRVYEETPVFTAIRLLPTAFLRKIVGGLTEQAKQAFVENVDIEEVLLE